MKFSTLRQANIALLPNFKNSKGEPAHSEPDGSDWDLDDWLVVVGGEVGKLLNLIKELRRGDSTLDDLRDDIGEEMASVIISLDILAFQIDKNDLGWTDADNFESLEVYGGNQETVAKFSSCLLFSCGYIADHIDSCKITAHDCIGVLLSVYNISLVLDINLGEAVERNVNLLHSPIEGVEIK